MSQSLSQVYIHIIFSVKRREPLILEDFQNELYAYMVSILKSLETNVLKIGGASDHIHILAVLSRKYSISKIIEEIKKSSSKWLKSKDIKLSNFYWQQGYGIFSVSQSQVENVKKYIENQKKHHQKSSYQEEFREILKKYNVSFDEKYVWD